MPLSALGLAKAKADPLFLSGGLLCVIKPAAHTNLRGCSPAMMAGHTPEEAGNGGSERVFLGGGAMALDSAFDAAAAGTGPSHTDPPTAAAPPFRSCQPLEGNFPKVLLVFGGKTQVLIDVFGLLATRLRLLSSACVGRREWRGRHQAVPAAPPTAARRRCRGGGGVPGAELTNILGEWAAHAFTWQTAEEPVAVGERAGQDGAARADGWRRLVCGCGEYNMIKKLAPHRPLQNCPLSQPAHCICHRQLPQPQILSNLQHFKKKISVHSAAHRGRATAGLGRLAAVAGHLGGEDVGTARGALPVARAHIPAAPAAAITPAAAAAAVAAATVATAAACIIMVIRGVLSRCCSLAHRRRACARACVRVCPS